MTSRPLHLLSLLLLAARPASADGGRIPIYQGTLIAQSGSYFLTRDITGPIVITATDVSLDLAGHTIQIQSGNIAIQGFWGGADAPDIHVHDGEIRGDGNGSGVGMSLARGSVVIERLRIRRVALGIWLQSDDQVERRARAVISDNTITDVAQGIDLTWYPGSVIERNVVRMLNPAFAPAIRAEGCSGIRIADNQITGGQEALNVANAENGIIVGNVVSRASFAGIMLVSDAGCTVARNVVGTTTGDGIAVVAGFSNTLDGNSSSRNSGMGFRFDGGSSGNAYGGNRMLGNPGGNTFGAGNVSTGGNTAGGPLF